MGILNVGIYARKPVFGVSDQVKPSQPPQLQRLARKFEILLVASFDMMLSIKEITKVLIWTSRCAGWSATFLFANPEDSFFTSGLICIFCYKNFSLSWEKWDHADPRSIRGRIILEFLYSILLSLKMYNETSRLYCIKWDGRIHQWRKGTFVVCRWSLQTAWTQIKSNKTLGLIWIHAVWHSDGIHEFLKTLILKNTHTKTQQTIKKACNFLQHVQSYTT